MNEYLRMPTQQLHLRAPIRTWEMGQATCSSSRSASHTPTQGRWCTPLPGSPMPLHLDLIHSSIPTLVRPTCLVVGSPSSKTHPHLTLATELGSYSYLSSKSRFSHFSLLFCHPLPPTATTGLDPCPSRRPHPHPRECSVADTKPSPYHVPNLSNLF